MSDARKWVSLDTETTGLDFERHDAWEVAAATEDGDEYVWQFGVRLDTADAFSLRMNGYWSRATRPPLTDAAPGWIISPDDLPTAERVVHPEGATGLREFHDAALDIYHVLDGRVVVASNPGFDFRMVGKILRASGLPEQPQYHHPLDIKTLAWGYLLGAGTRGTLRRDDKTDAIVDAAVGEPGWSERFKGEHAHTALGDARWVATALQRIEAT